MQVFRRSHWLLLWMLLACATGLRAQFLGGDGGGVHRAASPAIPCNALGIFNGSGGGGTSKLIRLPLVSCSFSMSYTGGAGGGAADTLIRNSTLDCGFFLGTSGGGHASAAPPVSALDCGFFLGTDGGGHSMGTLPVSQLDCASFFGSRGSGHDALEISDAIVNDSANLVWTGEKDRNWFDSENWSGCDLIPTCTRNVLIPPAANMPFINAPGAACHHITIQAGALLEMASGHNLNVCGDWDNQGQYVADVNASVTLVGMADQQVRGNCTLPNAFAKLIVHKPSRYVRLETEVQVQDTLALVQGLVLTESYAMTLLANGPDALKPGYGPMSYVHGNLRRHLQPLGRYGFAVGDTLRGYELAQVEFVEPTTITHLTARFDPFGTVPTFTSTDGECGNAGYDEELLNHGYWTIDAFPLAEAATGRYHMRLLNVGYSNARSSFTVVKRPTGTVGLGGWALDGTCDAGSVAANVSRVGMQGFSEFAVAQADTPFPLDALQLSAAAETDYIRLHWLSEAIVPSGRFQLLRGESPEALMPIASVEVPAQTAELRVSHNDVQVRRGVGYYYQVLRMEADGGTHASNVAFAILPRVQRFTYAVYPNPADTYVQVRLSAPQRQQVRLAVTNQLGQRLHDATVWTDVQQSVETIDMANWAAGVYYLSLSSGKEVDTLKLIKLRK
jgi:hypothetical protein